MHPVTLHRATLHPATLQPVLSPCNPAACNPAASNPAACNPAPCNSAPCHLATLQPVILHPPTLHQKDSTKQPGPPHSDTKAAWTKHILKPNSLDHHTLTKQPKQATPSSKQHQDSSSSHSLSAQICRKIIKKKKSRNMPEADRNM